MDATTGPVIATAAATGYREIEYVERAEVAVLTEYGE